MDKLQWFKFSYADWRMGKIQRCSEITQARFINLCCLYWSKDCFLSYDDAEIEIDKEHLDSLIKKKVIVNGGNGISISFLDEQFVDIESTNKTRSESGVIGNLKRWHSDIYKRYKAKEISLDEAIDLSQSIATQSQPDSKPIAPQSQNIADKNRIEETRKEDKISVDWDKLVIAFNNITKKKSRMVNTKARKQILERLKEGYTKEDLISAISNCYADEFHTQNNHKHLTLEFISRPDKLEAWLSAEKRELTEFEIEAEIKNKMQLVKKKNIAG